MNTTTFDPALHPRQPSGRFARTVKDAPAAVLGAPDTELAARRFALSELIANAPSGTALIHLELYSPGDPDLEMMAFSFYEDADGDEIDIDGTIVDEMYERAYSFDAETAVQHGFTRDGTTFTYPISRPSAADAAAEMEDRLTMRFLAKNDLASRAAADIALSEATAAYLRASADDLAARPSSLVITRVAHGLEISGLEDENERAIASLTPDDEQRLRELSRIAANITDIAAAGLATRDSDGTHRLIIR